MAKIEDPPRERAVRLLGYSVYLADLLAQRCSGVRVVVEGEGMRMDDVLAVHEDGRIAFTLNWIYNCLDDPEADNLPYKYAGTLRTFDDHERAQKIYSWLSGES
ncbi:hypothetical protein ACIRRA_44540 [Nocardia sp. NPDC101769]|uniref:hypothetical protein n=1 Tax=Nocardia sp. NPDC101769 TaxID=3364333 RepID=UPI003804F04B